MSEIDPIAAARALIEPLREHREQQTVAGGSWWEAPEICTQAADAIATLVDAVEAERARAEKAEAECDHALARLGVALTGARDRYAQAMLDYDYDESGPALAGLIRDLPLDPDAEAALQRALDAEWNKAVEASAGAQEAAYRKGVFGEKHPDHIRALARPTEGERDV